MNKEYYSIDGIYNVLYHHGIEGQKWGQRNGPPYPLDASDHSAAEKKASEGSIKFDSAKATKERIKRALDIKRKIKRKSFIKRVDDFTDEYKKAQSEEYKSSVTKEKWNNIQHDNKYKVEDSDENGKPKGWYRDTDTHFTDCYKDYGISSYEIARKMHTSHDMGSKPYKEFIEDYTMSRVYLKHEPVRVKYKKMTGYDY